MDNVNREKVISILNEIMKYELAGVVRYTHSALMVVGPYRESLVSYFNGQSSESLTHAQSAGDLLVSLGGHPSQDISIIKETNEHSITSLLEESLEHERKAVSLYKELLSEVVDKSIYLEEYAKEMIKNEEIHSLTVEKMLRDYE
ncbi:MAG: bacterioferritin [Gammaproteobacteria bacterium]|nr:bacterioferritin [Gammaproteobacteria bacterium]MBT7523729.1 bacterioferritin [Gammaproteobacteria bacterium]